MPKELLSRGVYELPYLLGGAVVLVAVDHAGHRIAEETVARAAAYPDTVLRLRAALDAHDPARLRLI